MRETFYGQSSRWSDPGDGNLYLDQAGAYYYAKLLYSF